MTPGDFDESEPTLGERMTSSEERFTVLADAFYRETGMFAPGNSRPLEFGMPHYTEDERWRAWGEFLAKRQPTAAPAPTPTPRTDAERLNWLDANPHRVSHAMNSGPGRAWYSVGPGVTVTPADSLRAAIDAGMDAS